MNGEASPPRSRAWWIALGLAALTAGVYLRVWDCAHLNYDDPDYVTANPVVSAGWSAAGWRWAWTTFHAANWHPLTWLSLMTDVELFGVHPGAQHLVNLGLHALNAVLLFFALRALTGRLWPSALVAAFFALHPLRVESVAWIAERKDLLAGACFLLLLLAYARHARFPGPASYGFVLLSFALGCLAKPMLVSAPFVLLLLDWWPLGRFQAKRRAGVLLEKLPLFLLAAGSCAVTVIAQRAGGTVGSIESLPFTARLANAGAAYLAYLRASVWPSGLAVFYPHPALIGKDPLVPGVLGWLVVLGVWAISLRVSRRAPWFFVGWSWFVGMLVPVIGLVQVGDQAWADRYAYLPLIGLQVAVVFSLAELARRRPALAPHLALAALAGLVACGIAAGVQVGHWKDSAALFQRALAVTEKNWVANNNLGLVHLERRELARALEHFQSAAADNPRFVQARFNLGVARQAAGELEPAVREFQQALAIRPGHPESLVALASLARASGDRAQAEAFYEQALQANERDPLPWAAFARMLLEEGELDRAQNCATSALRLDPRLAEAELVLGEIALQRGDVESSGRRLRRAVDLAPASARARALLGRWHIVSHDLEAAQDELEHALRLQPDLPGARYDLGTVFLNLRQPELARAHFQSVLDVVPGDPEANTALAVILIEFDRKPEQAIPLLETALARKPDHLAAHFNLAVACEQTGEWRRAAESYEKCLARTPPDADAARALAWILATCPDPELHDGERAVELATYAVQQQGARALEVLAAAHARKGDFDQAVRWQKEALSKTQASEHRAELEERLALFESKRPYTRRS